MNTIEFYYDYRSPFAYFASQRLDIFKNTRLEWKPVLVSGLLNLQVGKALLDDVTDAMCPAKRAHFMADIFRHIQYWNIPFSPPKPTPPVCDIAMAISAKLDSDNIEHLLFNHEIFKSVWQRQQDVQDKEVIRQCLITAGLNPELVDTAVDDGMAILLNNTSSAFEQGVFGTPSFIVDQDIYFGADRMELLAAGLVQLN